MKILWESYGINNLKREINNIKDIYAIGGSVVYTEIYVVADNTWSTTINYPNNGRGLVSTTLGNKGYSFGGTAQKNSAYLFDKVSYTSRNNYPSNMFDGGSEPYDDDTILIATGNNGSRTTEVKKSIVSTDTYSTWTSYPAALDSKVGGNLDGFIYFSHGGYPNSKIHCKFDTGEVWTTKTQGSLARRSPAAFVLNNYMYVVTGLVSSRTNKNDMYSYISNSWTAKTNYPILVNATGDSEIDEIGYMFGGDTGSGKSVNTYEYKDTTNAWVSMSDLLYASDPEDFQIN